MNYIIDVVLIVPILWAAFVGFKKGLIIEVISLLALVLGIFGGIYLSDYIGELLKETISSEYLPIAAFGLTFIVIVILMYLIGRMLEKAINMVHLKLLNKIAGMIFGAAKVILIISILIMIVNSYDKKINFIPEEFKESSLLFVPLGDLSLKIIPTIKDSNVFGNDEEQQVNQSESTI